jgi:hypothetical protein
MIEEGENIKSVAAKMMEDTNSTNTYITWNIEHMIKYGGNTDDLSIRFNTQHIGYDEKTVYHIMLKTDYNKLNHWDTMIELMLQRFLIRNSQNDNKDRYGGKKIKTYLLILKQNRYKVFDWDWEATADIEIKNECKKAIVNHFSGFSKPVFEYYNFIKTKKDQWKGHNSPLELIAYNEKGPHEAAYVTDFFKELHQQTLDGPKEREHAIQLTKSENKFCAALNERIEQMCDTFFGINNTLSDDIEW